MIKVIVLALVWSFLRIISAEPLIKGCAVEARAWQILHAAGIWSRLVRIEYGEDKDGHCVCVYPLANNDLWVYDHNVGSRKLSTKLKDIVNVTVALGDYYKGIRTSDFIDEL